MKTAFGILLLVGLSLALPNKRNGMCQTRKRNSSEVLTCIFNLLNGTKTPEEYKKMELLLLANQDTRDVTEVKRNGLCNTRRRNVDIACVLALLNTAKDDQDRMRIEQLLLASAKSQ